MSGLLDYPINSSEILKKKKALKRELQSSTPVLKKKIAILGGSTTSEVKNILELFLLKEGIEAQFYESSYNRYYEDAIFLNEALLAFKPDLIYLHTTQANLNFPDFSDIPEDVFQKVDRELEKFKLIWKNISETYKCAIIQNNFELPPSRSLGNLDFSNNFGKTHFISSLNTEFAKYARENSGFYINDINYLASFFGLERWHDPAAWYAYKYALSYDAIPILSHRLSRIISSIYGLSKKCLVLDLDNTLWGGVIGDDGLDGIQIGTETAVAEAFYAFQRYIKELKNRGVILAVCSKNDLERAKEGLNHPDSFLKAEDFSIIKANWDPKHENLDAIAKELNIDLSALVFVDDNPAEREIVRAQLPQVAVPEMGENIENFIKILDQSAYFEPVTLSKDDFNRDQYYLGNKARHESESRFASYEEYLASLEMKASIKRFSKIHKDRIFQLINKTNQFNLTTRRYTQTEVDSVGESPYHVTLYGSLSDKFGDNGIVSIIVAEIQKDELHIDLWLMSCRVLKRDFEKAMFDQLVREAKNRGLKKVFGYYKKTAKNDMVANFYGDLKFTPVNKDQSGDSVWSFEVSPAHSDLNKFIKVNQ